MFKGLETTERTKFVEDSEIYYNIEGLYSPLYIEPICSKKKSALLNFFHKA